MNGRYVKAASGRSGNATRGGTPGSHVNKGRNKRAANKAARRIINTGESEMSEKKVRVCVLCGEEMRDVFDQHNPWPLSNLKRGRCCTQCNNTKVIPERLRRVTREGFLHG